MSEAVSTRTESARSPGRRQAAWPMFAACLLAPAMAGTLRKLAPGQPSFLEIGGVGAVLVGGLWLLTRRRRLPGWIAGPLLVWAYFQLVYASLAMAVDWRVGAAATLTRIAPMLMAPIAYCAIRSAADFERASKWVAAVAAGLLPVGLVLALGGNEVLPLWLRPIQELTEIGKSGRAGVPALAGLFSTAHVLSMSMLAIFYICVANATLAESRRRRATGWWVVAVAALVLVFLSLRRGALLAGLIGLFAYFIHRGRVPVHVIAAVLVIGGGGLIVGQLGSLATERGLSRVELILHVFDFAQIPFRLIDIFGQVFLLWVLDAPFGTFLGFAGPEGEALAGSEIFAGHLTAVVEVGGAQLMAEMGVLGALLMPIVVVLLMWRTHRRSKGFACRRAIVMLLLFQGLFFALYYLKEMSAMTGVSMAQLSFWAVPGVCAALIERERRERRVWRAVWTMRAGDRPDRTRRSASGAQGGPDPEPRTPG